MQRVQMRDEAAIFSDIGQLCLTDGYIYVLAWICFRDNIILYEDHIQESDMEHLFSPNRIIRTELSTLAGLMVKGNISLDCPSSDEFNRLVDKTDELIKELHDVFRLPLSVEDTKSGLKGALQKKSFYREAFFYSGEPAYYFQFRDLAHLKYANDNLWFEKSKSYSVYDTEPVIKSICSIYQSKISNISDIFTDSGIDSEKLLGLFTFTVEEVANKSGLNTTIVDKVISSFSLECPCNAVFVELNDFNEYNATPLISLDVDKYFFLGFIVLPKHSTSHLIIG
jgi:hypothetical protein